MSGLKGNDAKVQVNGNSGNWNELAVEHDLSDTTSKNSLDDDRFGDDAKRRISGLVDHNNELTCRVDASDSQAVKDLRDASMDANERNETVDIEWSADGNTPSGPTEVKSATLLVSEYGHTASNDSPQERSVTLELADGNKPTYSGSFST